MTDSAETVEVPAEAADTAHVELNRLIRESEGEKPDPLTDRIFRSRDAFGEALDELGQRDSPSTVSVAEEAADVVGSRDDTHGDVRENHEQIAHMWSAYLGVGIEPHQVAEMMVLLKVSRCSAGSPDRDHYVDIAGYAQIAGELALEGGER